MFVVLCTHIIGVMPALATLRLEHFGTKCSRAVEVILLPLCFNIQPLL